MMIALIVIAIIIYFFTFKKIPGAQDPLRFRMVPENRERVQFSY